MAPLWLDVLDETIRTCAAHGRRDLAHRLHRKRTQLLDPTLRVMVVGAARQGKSQLVNALLNAPVCAVGGARGGGLLTVVRHADTPSAALVSCPAEPGPRAIGGATTADRVPVPLERLASGEVPDAPDGFVYAEVGVPRELLGAGLVLVDTPSIDTARIDTGGRAEVDPPVEADAVLLVCDAGTGLSDAAVRLLGTVARSCPAVTVVLTKIDLCPDWRRVAERARDRLLSEGVPARLVPVSSTLRLTAARTGDAALNAESGFPELLAALREQVSAKSTVLAPHTVRVLAGTVLGELATDVRERRAALDTGDSSAAGARLREAQQRLDDLRRLSVRWQNTLTDDILDLVGDVEYDLRERTRAILRRVDEVFDRADPATSWDAFQPWLAENLLAAAEANFAWLVRRAYWIAEKIAASFPPEAHALPERLVPTPADLFDERLAEVGSPVNGRFTLSQKLFTGLRGSYGGVVMFGLITGLTGLPLINPVSLGAGVVFGGKSLRDEGESRRLRRQAAAKAAVQRHVEDFFLRFGKECRDVARAVQRRLRDHFTALAEQLQEGIVEAARQAKVAAEKDAALREARAGELRRELERLVALHGRVETLGRGAAVPDPLLAAAG